MTATPWWHAVTTHCLTTHCLTTHYDDALRRHIVWTDPIPNPGFVWRWFRARGKDYKVCNKVWQFRCCSFALADWLKQSAEYSRIQKCLSMTSGMPHDDPWHRSVLLLDFEQHRCKTCFDWMPALINHTGPFWFQDVSRCPGIAWKHQFLWGTALDSVPWWDWSPSSAAKNEEVHAP